MMNIGSDVSFILVTELTKNVRNSHIFVLEKNFIPVGDLNFEL